MTDNIVEFGVKNVHYAKATYDAETKTYTYSSPVAIPGCTAISFDPSGSNDPFFADNIKYYVTESNTGYSGSATFAKIPKSFEEDILKQVKGIEKSDTKTEEFALLFEFDGDVNATKHIFWRCKAARPTIAGDTTEEKAAPKTTSISIEVSPRVNDNCIKGKVYPDNTKYDDFYTAVLQPSEVEAGYTT